jgi:hypothetical protein
MPPKHACTVWFNWPIHYDPSVRVSLAIHGCYVPENFSSVKIKTAVFSLKQAKTCQKGSFYSIFSVFLLYFCISRKLFDHQKFDLIFILRLQLDENE